MTFFYQFLWLSLTVKIILASNVETPDCQNRRIIFTAEPKDFLQNYSVKAVAVFPCQYKGSDVTLHWIINGTTYSPHVKLPPDHHYNKSTHSLFVTNPSSYSGTTYQCQLLPVTGPPCVYRSTSGKLISGHKEATQNELFKIETLPHYAVDIQRIETLREISTTFTQVGNVETLYNISYSDAASGSICNTSVIPPSSCIAGTCSHELDIPSSPCPNNSDIIVTVSMTDGILAVSKIAADNTFIKVHIDKKGSSVTLAFINQPSESDKHYSMSYGPETPGCKHLPFHVKGHLSHSNSISVGLNNIRPDDAIICLKTIVTNGTTTFSLEGVYSIEYSTGDEVSNNNYYVVALSILICGLVTLTSLAFISYITHRQSKRNSAVKYISVEKGCSSQTNSTKHNLNPLEPIDLSTTAYRLLPITKKCMVYKLKIPDYPDFRPSEGFGYCKYKMDQIKKIKSKRIVLMDKNGETPTHTILGSATLQGDVVNKDLYVQENKTHHLLQPGDAFLFCARSKTITTTVFKKIFHIPEECAESTFLKLKISGYTAEWIRYGYFEFTKPECITPSQRIIVQKKDGQLVTGPGIRHLIGAREGDGSKLIQPPNLQHHPEWDCVFVQSNGSNRQLLPNTKFLFCAMMNKISEKTHSNTYIVQNKCTLEEFGKRYNLIFKADTGYGYFEFIEKEHLKLHKNVIVMDKRGRLFTGAGAKFYYTGCDYGEDELEKRKRVSPPDLRGTDLIHVFIQSWDKNRILQPGTKFLYCEYNTEQF